MENPYQPPAAYPVVETPDEEDAESGRLRVEERWREVRGVGTLYQLGGLITLAVTTGMFAGHFMGRRELPDLAIAGVYFLLGALYLATGSALYRLHGWARIAGIALGALTCLWGNPFLMLPGLTGLFVLWGRASARVCTAEYRLRMAETLRPKSGRRWWIMGGVTLAAFLYAAFAG